MNKHILSEVIFTKLTNGALGLLIHSDFQHQVEDLAGALVDIPAINEMFTNVTSQVSLDGGVLINDDACINDIILPLIMTAALNGNKVVAKAFRINDDVITGLTRARTQLVLNDNVLWTKGGGIHLPMHVASGLMFVKAEGSSYIIEYYDGEATKGVATESVKVTKQADVLSTFIQMAMSVSMEESNFNPNRASLYSLHSVCGVDGGSLRNLIPAWKEKMEAKKKAAHIAKEKAESSKFTPTTIMRIHAHYGLVYLGGGVIGNCFTGEVIEPTEHKSGLVYSIANHYGIDGNDTVIPYSVIQDGIHTTTQSHQAFVPSAHGVPTSDDSFEFGNKKLSDIQWRK